MRLTDDYVRAFRGRLSGGGRCQVRIYESESGEVSSTGTAPVVVCSELPDEGYTARGESPLADAAEYLAAEVIANHRLSANPPCWIEHRLTHAREGGSEQWSSVVFAHYVPEKVLAPGGVWRTRIGRPERTPLKRETVEALVGHPV